MYFKMVNKRGLVLLVGLLFLFLNFYFVSATTIISDCNETGYHITSPGFYRLNQSAMTNVNSETCVNIDSSNVIFDGGGNIISYNYTSGDGNWYTTAAMVGQVTNVTVQNLNTNGLFNAVTTGCYSSDIHVYNVSANGSRFEALKVGCADTSGNILVNNFTATNCGTYRNCGECMGQPSIGYYTGTNVTFENINVQNGVGDGILINSPLSRRSYIINATFLNNAGSGINILASDANVSFINVNSSGNGNYSIFDGGSTGSARSSFGYSNSFGSVDWISNLFLSNLTMTDSLLFGGNIKLSNNSFYLNPNQFSSGNINSPANVTLYNVPVWSSVSYISYNGSVCNDKTTPSCYNLTLLSAGTVIFNVSVMGNYSIVPYFLSGDGSSGNPYPISSWSDLDKLRYLPSSYYILKANLSSATSDYSGIGNNFQPIGTVSSPFSGNFNGNGNTISNLTVYLPTQNYTGLFGYSTGTISNVGLLSVNVTGYNYVGGLVGYENDGAITNCYTVGTTTAVVVGGAPDWIPAYVGGLVGSINGNNGVVSNCYSKGNVYSNSGYMGGLVGYKDAGAAVSNSYSTANIFSPSNNGDAGGLVGRGYWGLISNCYATGSISINGKTSYPFDDWSISGLLGDQYFTTVNHSYWNSDSTGITGSVVDYNGGIFTDVTGRTTAQLKNISSFIGWNISENTTDLNNGYPFLAWQAGSNSSVWMILDKTLPVITIIYPASLNYTGVSRLNYSIAESNLQSCWYSLDNGVTNHSVVCGTNLTGLTSVEGANNWAIYANDTSGNNGSAQVIFFKDTIAPSINVYSPALYSKSSQVLINFSSTDAGVGVSTRWFNNGTINITYTIPVNITLPQGNDTIIFYSNDSLNNVNSTTRTVYVDTVSPFGNLTAPSNNTNSNNSINNFSANLSDNLGVHNATLNIYNSTGLVNQTTVTYVSGTVTATVGVVVTLIDNVYTWFYNLFDWAGNSYTTSNNTMTIDTTPPFVLVTYPDVFGYTSNPGSVSYNTSDLNGLAECWTILNGNNLGDIPCGDPSGSYTLYDSSLIQGINNISIYARDNFGNVNVSNKSFLLDNQPPMVSFAEPSTVSGNYTISYITGNVSASDVQFKNVTLNIYNQSGGLFFTNTTSDGSALVYGNPYVVNDGMYYMNATAWDNAGNSNFTETRIIMIDRVVPTISFLSGNGVNATLANGSSFSSNTLLANVSIAERFRKNVTFVLYDEVKDSIADIKTFTDSTNSTYLNSAEDGFYSIQVSVFDWVGYSASTAKRYFYKDTHGPVASSWSYSSNSSSVNASMIVSDFPAGVFTVISTVYDSANSVINTSTLSRNFGTINNGSYSINLTGLSVGDYRVAVFTNDTGGAVSNYNFSFDIYPLANFSFSGNNSDSNSNFFVNFSNAHNDVLGSFSSFNSSNFSAKDRDYHLTIFSNNNSVDLTNVSFNSPQAGVDLYISNISSSLLSIPTYKPLKVIAGELNNLSVNSPVIINLTYIYPQDVLNVNESGLTIHKCVNWNFSTNNCNGDFDLYTQKSVDTLSKIITINTSGFSAYVITGATCHAHGCQPEYGENINNCPSDCNPDLNGTNQNSTQNNNSPAPSSSGGGGGGGGGGGASTTALVSTPTISTQKIVEEIAVGEKRADTVSISNSLSNTVNISLNLSGDVTDIMTLSNKTFMLAPGASALVTFNVYGQKEGVFVGSLIVSPSGLQIPVVIVVGGKQKLLDVSITPDKKSYAKGSPLDFKLIAINMGKLPKYDLDVTYELVSIDKNITVYTKQEAIAIETTLSQDKSIDIPKDIAVGNYLLVAKVNYSSGLAVASANVYVGDASYIMPIWVQQYLPVGLAVLFVLILSIVGGYYVIYLRKKLFEKEMEEIKKNSIYKFPDFDALPHSKFAYIGEIADTKVKTYLDYTQLNRHTLIAGGTGSGKTISGMVIAEELLKRDSAVIVFDPVGQWGGFFDKNHDKTMLAKYKKFGLGSPKNFSGKIIPITKETMDLDIKHYVEGKGLVILKMDHLTPHDVDEFIFQCLEKLYHGNLKEVSSLKTLLVFDEVHRLLPKYGGHKAYTKLEQAVREFRKWGIGLLMISQVLTDFKGAIRGNIGTEVQMFSRYEGDIKRVRERHGSEISKLVSRLPTGIGMVEAAGYNKGNPYFVEFRPILHSPIKLEEQAVKKYIDKEPVMSKKEEKENKDK